jgi:hypothetical protein
MNIKLFFLFFLLGSTLFLQSGKYKAPEVVVTLTSKLQKHLIPITSIIAATTIIATAYVVGSKTDKSLINHLQKELADLNESKMLRIHLLTQKSCQIALLNLVEENRNNFALFKKGKSPLFKHFDTRQEFIPSPPQLQQDDNQ